MFSNEYLYHRLLQACSVLLILLVVASQQHAISGHGRRAAAAVADPTICSLTGGSIDPSSGQCELCINSANCECVIDTVSFAVTCANFCIATQPEPYCGPVSCTSGTTSSSCEGANLIVATGGENENGAPTIRVSFTCDASRVCTCSAEFNRQPCSECVGAADGIDCSNVAVDGNTDNGPCLAAGSCIDASKTQPPTSAPVSLPRPYRTDSNFLDEVQRMSLPEASSLAGVPIGAAVPDNAGGRVWSLDAQKKWVPSVYNMIVVENGMKWNNLLEDPNELGVYNFTNADAILDHAVSVGAKVRGHVLIWGRGKGKTYPESVALQVEQSDDPKGTLKDIMVDHITTVASHFKGKVDVWDVVNEHLSSQIDENIFYTTLGSDYVRFAFETASSVLPDETRLIWNEALSDFRLDDPTITWWLDTLRTYKKESVPIHGIGVQGHNINQKHNISDLAIFLREVVDMGYDVELTEIDAPIKLFLEDDDYDDPFSAQGDFFKEYTNACLNTGRCKGITFWGLDDGHTWYDSLFTETKPNLPLLIDEEGYMKPAFRGVREALEESTSREEEASNAIFCRGASFASSLYVLGFIFYL